MVEPLIIIPLALFIVWIAFVVLAFFFKIFRTILKIFFIANVILFVVSAAYGYLLYKDFIDLKENFPTQEKLFLLKDGEQYIAGFTMKELSMGDDRRNEDENGLKSSGTSSGDSSQLPTKPLSKEKLASYSGKKLSEVLEGRYKIIIINAEMFKKQKRISLQPGLEFTGNELITLIKKDDSFGAFAEFMAEEQLKKQGVSLKSSNLFGSPLDSQKKQFTEQIKESFNIKDEGSFDSLVLVFMTMGTLQEQGPLFLVEQLKTGDIAIYPNTIIFKSIKLIPNKAFELAAEKVAGKLETEN
ncbi:hypothetical protein J4206_06645 [Candidatus Woesearchaeota archaeon]|nr:hypothetical protein [Candidatus Woesearchaeota archaeon]